LQEPRRTPRFPSQYPTGITSNAAASRRSKILFLVLLVVGVPIASFVAIEGLSSLLLLAKQLGATRGTKLAEETTTTYDAEIGWVGKKSFTASDLYGPGISLHTNARGFRGRDEIDDAAPAGKQRLVCLGDSFTLGYGVSDDDTWCARLASPGLQTVNMGQGAYGIDQAYLWYKRDARAMAHDFQLLAIITDDFRRMESDRFLNFAKPWLTVRADSLVVLGVPVPRTNRAPWRDRIVPAVQSLRTAQLFASLTNGSRSSRARPDRQANTTRQQRSDVTPVVAHIVAELARLNAAKGSRLVLVYLPVDTDFQNEASASWRQAMRAIADSLHVPLIDLIPAQRKLDRQKMRALYIPKGNTTYANAEGHFTIEGNRWAAEQIRAALDSLQHVSAKTAVR